ncbi:ABC transporter substrate-binding protein [Vallitalea okinawensis]|uniref:ABC transporter substrate-binding protein n=1 Tax=Vallitalea okinawensis TaxID=2078660 RepID=UPI000CFAE6BE|nr:extracellular solute-binding protein [Vallitalea okinawensis]
MGSKFKKTVALLLVLSMNIALFAGCTGEEVKTNEQEQVQQDRQKEGTQDDDQKDVTLNVMHWRVEDAEVFDRLNEQFNQEYPNVKIEMDPVPTKNYANAVTVRLASGEADIVGVDPLGQLINKIPAILKGNALYDLTGQEFLDNYNPSIWGDNAVYEGKVLAVPTSLNTVVVFYNKDLFKELNLEIPKTYAEFIEACEVIKAEGIDPIGFGGKDGWPVNVDMIGVEGAIVRSENPDFYKQLATGETKFTDPLFVEVLSKLKEISKYFEEDSMGVAYDDVPVLFSQKKVAMILDGSWSAANIQMLGTDFEVGVFLFPGSDNVDPANYVPVKYGLCWAISNESENKEAALKYLEFLSRPDVYADYITSVNQMPTQDGITFTDPLLTEVAGLLGNNIEFVDQVYPPGSNIDPWQSLQAMIIGAKTPEEVAKEMQDKVDSMQ